MEKIEIISGENHITVGANFSGTGTTESPVGYTGEIHHFDKRELLWETTGNDYNTDIELSETIHHFDKLMIYGSGIENEDTLHLSKNVYIVQPNLINGCDIWGYSPWTTSFQANYILGADIKLSGNSGHIGSSYYWGIGSKNTTWAAGKWTGTEAPKMLMPWKIFGIGRHPSYNFYGLDSEGGSVSSNINPGYSGDIATLTTIPSGDEWKCSAINITGAILTGNDFMFENSNVTAQAEFEHSRELTIEPTTGGVISANLNSGFSGDVVTLSVESIDEGYKFSSYNVTGSEATGNDIMFIGSDITAQGNFEHYKDLTLINNEHATLSADAMTGFIGDVVTVDTVSIDEGWYFTGLNITGAVATGNKFTFIGNNVTAEGLYTDEGYPITYLSDDHVSLTSDVTIFIPGSEGITLDSGYDTYYRISGYDITGGSIIDGKLVPTGPCTIKAVEMVNYFTATGDFETGSNITVTSDYGAKSTAVPTKYAVYIAHTGDIPSSWYETSNRWKPSDVSAYSITLNTKMTFTLGSTGNSNSWGAATAISLIGDSVIESGSFKNTGSNTNYTYNKTITDTTQNINYGISAKLIANGYVNTEGWYYKGTATYIATGTTGTWTATGIAP